MINDWKIIRAAFESGDAERIEQARGKAYSWAEKTLSKFIYECAPVEQILGATLAKMKVSKDKQFGEEVSTLQEAIIHKMIDKCRVKIYYDRGSVQAGGIVFKKYKSGGKVHISSYRVTKVNGNEIIGIDLNGQNKETPIPLTSGNFILSARISEIDRARLSQHFFFFDD